MKDSNHSNNKVTLFTLHSVNEHVVLGVCAMKADHQMRDREDLKRQKSTEKRSV